LKKKPIWQQKYSALKEITTENQLENTLVYIQTNRSKHQLKLPNEGLQSTMDNRCCALNNI